jgi:hypothetical protein
MPLSRLLEKLEFAEDCYYDEKEWHYRDEWAYRIIHSAFLRVCEARENLRTFYTQADLVGRICVKKRLPSGDPCWMSQLIMSYVE